MSDTYLADSRFMLPDMSAPNRENLKGRELPALWELRFCPFIAMASCGSARSHKALSLIKTGNEEMAK
jgi:hypothetical protein